MTRGNPVNIGKPKPQLIPIKIAQISLNFQVDLYLIGHELPQIVMLACKDRLLLVQRITFIIDLYV